MPLLLIFTKKVLILIPSLQTCFCLSKYSFPPKLYFKEKKFHSYTNSKIKSVLLSPFLSIRVEHYKKCTLNRERGGSPLSKGLPVQPQSPPKVPKTTATENKLSFIFGSNKSNNFHQTNPRQELI